MTTPKIIMTVLTLFLLSSCKKTHKLTGEDFTWMPYKGNETLAFTSNLGNTDTIFCIKKDTLLAYPEAQSPKGSEYEEVSVFCKHTDKTSDSYRFLENSLVELKKSKDAKARLHVYLATKDANFYRLSGFPIDSLKQVKLVTLQTKNSLYSDVYVLNAEDWLNFKERSDYVTKVYWSKTQGIVRYDKQDGTYWELTNKYGL